MPEVKDTPKSLTVHFYVQKTGVDIPMSGAEIGIFRVAELNCNGGSADYILLPQYESLKRPITERISHLTVFP